MKERRTVTTLYRAQWKWPEFLNIPKLKFGTRKVFPLDPSAFMQWLTHRSTGLHNLPFPSPNTENFSPDPDEPRENALVAVSSESYHIGQHEIHEETQQSESFDSENEGSLDVTEAPSEVANVLHAPIVRVTHTELPEEECPVPEWKILANEFPRLRQSIEKKQIWGKMLGIPGLGFVVDKVDNVAWQAMTRMPALQEFILKRWDRSDYRRYSEGSHTSAHSSEHDSREFEIREQGTNFANFCANQVKKAVTAIPRSLADKMISVYLHPRFEADADSDDESCCSTHIEKLAKQTH
ncbi:unnamed protein product [Notodromas monacha]|uniref:Uncharacterized protein n=1 Tax=Notodromas monacha TaxID=399045 RepID=A0A7R9C3K7_9CRUS|nr:unnamed protein product [Notodromas monacha]CAG0925556.1 unnamed protein product [Notodromas monacha]